MWEGSWVDQNKAGSFLVGCFLMCCCPGESYSWSRPWASTWLPPRLPLPSLQLKHQLSSPKRPEEGSLDFLAFNSNGKKPWPLPGMEWAGLSPKCKCHFSTSLVTTPFLAFIGNDISCVLCLQHMLQKGAGSYYALKGWRKKKTEETCSPNTKEYREHKSGYGVTQAPCKVEERKDCLCVSLLLACFLLLLLFLGSEKQ